MKSYEIAGDIGGVEKETLKILLSNNGFKFKKEFLNGFILFVKNGFELRFSIDQEGVFLFVFDLDSSDENEVLREAQDLKNIFEVNALPYIIEIYERSDPLELIESYRNWHV